MSLIEDLSHLGEMLRGQGKRIVWTNGVFDLLHVGHVRSLEAAKSLGDFLVVGVNSDDSTARLKSGRPIIPDIDRAAIVSALRCVGHVVLFSTDDPTECIERLRPDVLCKGEQYSGQIVAGAEIVRSYGGRVEFLPMVSGVSTTKILERIRA